jgi:hypothetical protein
MCEKYLQYVTEKTGSHEIFSTTHREQEIPRNGLHCLKEQHRIFMVVECVVDCEVS